MRTPVLNFGIGLMIGSSIGKATAPQTKPYVYELQSVHGGFKASLPAIPKESVTLSSFSSLTNPFGREIQSVAFDPDVRGGDTITVFFKDGWPPKVFTFESFGLTTSNKSGNRYSKPGILATLKVTRG